MPRIRAGNVTHAAVTDHSIPRQPLTPAQETGGSVPQLRAWREPELGLVARDLGLAYFELATDEHAAADLNQAYRILSRLPPVEADDPPVDADLASLMLVQNQPGSAIQLFERASAQQPGNARYAYCLGVALWRAGRVGEAIKALTRGIQLDPSLPDAYLELAQLYQKIGQASESRRVIQEYLRFMPQNIRLRSAD